MKLLWIEKHHGAAYRVLQDDNGQRVYDPPLPPAIVAQSERRGREMLISGRAPRAMTDDVLMTSMPTIAQEMERDPIGTARRCRISESLGYTPKPTDIYMGSIADGEGDPLAYLNHGRGAGHVRAVSEMRGIGGEGIVTVKAREPEHDPYENPVHRLNPKIVERKRRERIKENPELARGNQEELRSEILDTHTPKG